MADYVVKLFPVAGTTEQEDLVFEDVELGFNQIGWLVFTNRNREPMSAFTPGVVQFVLRVPNDDAKLVLDETLDVEAKLIN